MYRLELTEAERDLLLKVFDAGFAAMGVTSLIGKLRGVAPQAPAPAPEADPAA
jgi:hypothetical protein